MCSTSIYRVHRRYNSYQVQVYIINRVKLKHTQSVSRHLSTRISDRPIDAFVSFYPSDTAAVLPACPIWHLSVFFLLYRWRSDPTVQPAFYLFLFFLEAVVSFPPFILVSMAASWRGGRPHEEAAPGELRGSSRGRRGEGPGDPRGLSQGRQGKCARVAATCDL